MKKQLPQALIMSSSKDIYTSVHYKETLTNVDCCDIIYTEMLYMLWRVCEVII